VQLTAGGQAVMLGEVEQLGFSVASTFGATTVWRVKVPDFLAPSTNHVLSVVEPIDAGVTGQVELTRFTTAAGYDKQLGIPPKARTLELWRVRYPLGEINSGNCVFAEYRGYIRINYDPATIPNTTPDGTIYSITLGPKTGGSNQAFYFPGDDLFKGMSPELDPHALDRWAPELDPSREYCATITAFGDGDLARLPSTSESICASVKQLSSYVDDAASGPGALPDASAESTEAGSGSPALAPGPQANGCSCTMFGNPARQAQRLPIVAAIWFGFVFGRTRSRRRQDRIIEGERIGCNSCGSHNGGGFEAGLPHILSSKS
jgi:hypothetical protein